MSTPSLAHLLGATTAQNPPPYYNRPAGVPSIGLYTRLGSTGAVVSRICLGLMSYTDEEPMFPWYALSAITQLPRISLHSTVIPLTALLLGLCCVD